MNKLIERLAKSSIGAMFGMVPAWAWCGLLALSLVMFGGYVNGLRWEAKHLKHLDDDSKAVKTATDTQAAQNQTAATDYIQTVADGKVKIEYRTKEVKIYVEKNNRLSAGAGVDCRVDADFVSVYNHTSPATKAAD